MKYLLNIFFLFFCLSVLSAQEKHFVFIQSDNNQPFYVSLNGKLYSSTAKGYIIIPKLTDGNYNFSIGFAQNAYPEQSFQYVINKDIGFNLKNFGEKGWGLFNLQSLSVTMAESGKTDEISKALSEKAIAKEDADPIISFNKKKKDAMAEQGVTKNAADTLADQPVAKNEKPKDQEEQEVKPDNTVIESEENNKLSVDAQTTEKASEKKTSSALNRGKMSDVKKVSEIKETDGVHLFYADRNGKKTDTIHVIIPSDKYEPNTENYISSSPTEVSNSTAATSAMPSADSLKFLDVDMNNSKKDIKQEGTGQENNVTAITNSKCKNIATDEDYARLRRKMAMEITDEKMINEARKIYRNKCFTTSQIKKLSTLFLSDEGRYNFFNASYNSVADVSQYYSLQSEFIDPAFVSRFKTLLQ